MPNIKLKKMLETELRFIKMQVANMNNRITNIEVILQDLKWAEEENEKL